MVRFVSGDIFSGGHENIVCTVNTVGVMDKGVALEFKKRFPEQSQRYIDLCTKSPYGPGSGMGPGGVLLAEGKPNIFFLATKAHWRNPSQYEWIWTGATNLKGFIRRMELNNIGIPALGCGNGGLDWIRVKEGMNLLFADMKDRDITFYEPAGFFDINAGVAELV